VEEVQPGPGTPAPAKSSPGCAMSPPPRILQAPTTPASMALSPPHTPSVVPRPLAAERRHDTGRLQPDLRQMRQSSYGGAHATSSSSSSSRRTRVATPPSRFTSSSFPERSRSQARSDSFSSQISRLSTPSTAPTSYVSSVRGYPSSGRAVHGLTRSRDSPPTPTRSSRDPTSTHAAMQSSSPRILRSTRRSDSDATFSLPDRTRGLNRW